MHSLILNVAHQLTAWGSGSGTHRSTAPDSPERTGLADSAGRTSTVRTRRGRGCARAFAACWPAPPHSIQPARGTRDETSYWVTKSVQDGHRPLSLGAVCHQAGWKTLTKTKGQRNRQTPCTGRPKHTSRGIFSTWRSDSPIIDIWGQRGLSHINKTIVQIMKNQNVIRLSPSPFSKGNQWRTTQM